MKRQISSQSFLLLVLVSIGTSVIGCAGSVELAGGWRDREITIDGQAADWQDATTFLKESNVSVGVRNDGEYLYVCLVTTDRRMQTRIAGLGFTVWIDPQGGKARSFGIRFPLGAPMQGRRPMDGSNPEELRRMLEQSGRELEIVGATAEDRQRMSVLDARGVQVRIGRSQESLVYELKVALRKTNEHPFAVGLEGSNNVGIGFETAELGRDVMRERAVSSRPTGGRGGGRGGSRPTPPADIGRADMPEQLKLWTVVLIATESPVPKSKL